MHIAAATPSVKEAKFQPFAPLLHISLDGFPVVQVRGGSQSFTHLSRLICAIGPSLHTESCGRAADTIAQDAVKDAGFCSAPESKVLECPVYLSSVWLHIAWRICLERSRDKLGSDNWCAVEHF